MCYCQETAIQGLRHCTVQWKNKGEYALMVGTYMVQYHTLMYCTMRTLRNINHNNNKNSLQPWLAAVVFLPSTLLAIFVLVPSVSNPDCGCPLHCHMPLGIQLLRSGYTPDLRRVPLKLGCARVANWLRTLCVGKGLLVTPTADDVAPGACSGDHSGYCGCHDFSGGFSTAAEYWHSSVVLDPAAAAHVTPGAQAVPALEAHCLQLPTPNSSQQWWFTAGKCLGGFGG